MGAKTQPAYIRVGYTAGVKVQNPEYFYFVLGFDVAAVRGGISEGVIGRWKP